MTDYTVALYIRLSSEDIDLNDNKLESSSIVNQRKLLKAYINNDTILRKSTVIEFCDDGYSGKNFNRPKVIKMLDMAKKKELDCIIVKDLSRFGRDKITVCNYLEHIFPFIGVRFISINDGYDSSNISDIGSLDSNFRVLLYDLYSRDMSNKIKRTFRMKAEKGEYMPSFVPYGYLKDKKTGIYVINEEPAKVVKRIFQLTLQGEQAIKIAKILNDELVPTKMKIKQQEGVRLDWGSIHNNNLWDRAAIALILRDETYIGARIYGKGAVTAIGSRSKRYNNKKDWIIVYNRHESIVSKHVFDKVQQLLRVRDGNCITRKHQETFLYRKVRCGCCGLALRRRVSKQLKYFICNTPSKLSTATCYQGHIYYDDIKEMIIEVILTQAKIAVNIDRIKKEKAIKYKEDRKILSKELINTRMSLEKMDSLSMQLYESLILQEIEDDIYNKEIEALNTKKELIEKRIQELELELEPYEEANNQFVETYKEYINKELITDEVMNELVEEVLVDREGKIKLRLSVSYDMN